MANRRYIDFPIASSVGDNDIVLIWQDGMNKQTTKGTLIQGAPTSLEGLTDVDIAGLINGQILQYNSTTGKWENVDRTDINLSELGDVSIVSPTNGQVLVYNSSTSKWENSSGGYVPYTGAVTTVNLGAQTIQAGSFVKAGGTSSQFLKADGSVDSNTYGTGTVTSVGLTMPSAFSVANTPVTTAGTLAVTGAGTTAQYIRGDGSLSTFPALTGFVPYTGATANVDLGEYELKSGQLTLDTSPTGTAAVGTTRWNDNIGSSETTLKGGSVVLKNGVDLVARVVNKVTPNTTLTKAAYQAVRISGAQGQRLAVAFAQANNDNNSADTIGLVTETIATNQEGFILTVGQLENINTTGSLQGETWSDGDVLYLSPTTPGAITKVKPNGSTGHIIVIGYVEYAHAIHGKIYVKIMNGWELDELHNVYINNPLNNQGLFYTSSTQLWENKSIATALGYTPANAATTITINGTTYDLSANRTWNVGTVTGNGTTNFVPKYTSGGLAIIGNSTIQDDGSAITLGNPTLVVGSLTATSIIKSGGTSSQYLMADGSVSTLTNLVTGSGTTNYLPKFTGTSTIGNSQIFDNGTGVGINNASPIYILDAYSTGTGTARIRIQGTTNFALTQAQNSSGVLYMGIDSSSADGFGLGNYSRVIYSNNAYPLVFAVNDAEAMRITSGRNLLVGTTTDNGARLQVSGSATFSSSVGINTTSPSAPLHIVTPTGVNFQNAIRFEKAGGYGEVNLENYYTSGSNYGFGVDVAGTTMMVVNNSGNFGIGSTSPGVRLVNSGATLASVPTLGSGTIGANAILSANGFYGLYTGVSPEGHVWQQVQRNDGNTAVYPLVLQPSGGNVLIGTTTNGSSKLKISGLPTSSAGLSSGDVWNDSGTLKIA